MNSTGASGEGFKAFCASTPLPVEADPVPLFVIVQYGCFLVDGEAPAARQGLPG